MDPSMLLGINLTIIGTIIVFIVLAFIAVVINIISYFDRDWQNREKKQLTEALTKPSSIDDISLALITAAVATVLQGQYRIKRITRLRPSSQTSVWSIQGRSVLLGSHIITKKHGKS
ncbi:MAG: OadG family protein [bacterium]